MKRIYLDNAAATPLDADVFDVMQPFLKEVCGNPSSIHQEGVAARKAVEEARARVAGILHVRPKELVFVGSGTESDNLAIQGVVSATRKNTKNMPHVITTQIEHSAVLETVRALECDGYIRATYLSVDSEGLVDLSELKESIEHDTVLVSIGYANSEVGVVQPIRDIARVIREVRKKHKSKYPYFHTDACQAMNTEHVNMESLGVDLLSFNGSKIYGPKGIGVLVVGDGVPMAPIVYGGEQEQGHRAGTENVAGIVGVSVALEKTRSIAEAESSRLRSLSDYFRDLIIKKLPQVELNGSLEHRLPYNVHITVPNIEEDVLVVELDAKNIACSSKSACKATDTEASHVLVAMGKMKENASSLRFSLGRETTKEDVEYTVQSLCDILEKYKDISL